MASSDKFKDCECEATLFYQKYKERIYRRLEQISDFDTEIEDYLDYDDTSRTKYKSDQKSKGDKKHYRDKGIKSEKGKHGVPKSKSKKDFAKTLKEKDGKDKDERDIDGKDTDGKGKGTDGKDKDKYGKDKGHKDDKGRKDRDVKEENLSEIGSEILDRKSGMYLTSAGLKTDDELGSSLEQEERYLEMALDSRIQEIFGEEMEESVPANTERGYYIFERSDQGTVEKMPSISTLSGEEEQEYYLKPKPTVEIPWMSDAERRANEYLKTHKIWDLFKFMGSHLVCANPCNPIDFLITLLDNCLNYRAGYCDPPLLFLPKHIESLFNSMDPMHTGFIEMHQYHTGMYTLGIKDYNIFPKIVDGNLVHKEIFMNEAFFQLKNQLNEMIHSSAIPITISTFSSIYTLHGEDG